ncbi:hypothetical protein Kisp01_58180 [Kineosporia sp. NBRC 101677]|uniref:sulfur carrier protein ThiS n=1 Tax=Kineosporia sp. NBRC 101677 TaxID=3032197 RepID=UPI0024A34973|nr:sulfur carrier protein ThiS [Kineosporia sp. NBRC 101677]GLY18804.1 hypothetical protein Kisp01_58180 [Kineosporia sp. NBRC 101677]
MSTVPDGEVEVVVNGKPLRVPRGCSVADVVACFAPTVRPGRGTAVALNEEIVPAGRWSQTTVAGGERLELLQAVAGG